MKERLQKLLAQANIGSRRASEDLIGAGRVRVNGVVAQLGDKADPAADSIEVDGVLLKFEEQAPVYVMLNKPKQVLSTDKPHKGDRRETVSGLLGRHEHLFSIGRLDADSEGLVVMTNDGDLAQKLSHPRYRHTKTYRVEVLGLPTAETLEKWQAGVFLEDGKTAPCFVEIVKGSPKGTILRVVMTEGKKRQIRRVASLLGHPVRRLTRTHIGMLALGDLEPGQSRELTAKEVLALKTPSPEIKALRAQPRRRIGERDSAAADAPRGDTRRPARARSTEASTEARDDRRPTPRRSAGSRDDDGKKRGIFRVADVVDEAPGKRPARRIRTSGSPSGSPDERRAPRTRSAETAGETAENRPVRRARRTDAADDAPDKRRVVRTRTSDAASDRRPARRVGTSDMPDDSPDKRRRSTRTESDEKPRSRPQPGIKPAEPPKDPSGKPRAPRDRKPESGDTGVAKRRPPKPFAPFKNRGSQQKRKPGTGKGRQR